MLKKKINTHDELTKIQSEFHWCGFPCSHPRENTASLKYLSAIPLIRG